MFCSGDPRRISSVFDFPQQRLNIGSCDAVRCVKLFCNSVFKKAFFSKRVFLVSASREVA